MIISPRPGVHPWFLATSSAMSLLHRNELVGSLLLNGLEIFDEDEEITTDDFLANRAAPGHFPKALAPDGHLPTAMGRDDGSPVDVGGNLGYGEVPATPLGNPREIGR